MRNYWIAPALALALTAGCGKDDDTGDSGATGTGTGAGTGTGTGATGGQTYTGPTEIDVFQPPGCSDDTNWVYAVDTKGWAGDSLMNAFETGQANVLYRWNQEDTIVSLNAEPYNQADHLGITLTDEATYATYSEGVNTVYRCGYHDGANASNFYVARIYDLQGNFADCGFGIDANAPAGAKAEVTGGDAWDTSVHTEPSGDWNTEFNSGCGDWNFQ